MSPLNFALGPVSERDARTRSSFKADRHRAVGEPLYGPYLTLRDNTERPITISQGTNKLVRADDLAARLSALISETA